MDRFSIAKGLKPPQEETKLLYKYEPWSNSPYTMVVPPGIYEDITKLFNERLPYSMGMDYGNNDTSTVIFSNKSEINIVVNPYIPSGTAFVASSLGSISKIKYMESEK